jgi:galactokinase
LKVDSIKILYFSVMVLNIAGDFQEVYGRTPMVASAPGRVNLIGEHTDYNEGFVLPGAVDKKIYVALAENNSGMLHMYARQFREKISFPLDSIHPVKGWPTYLLGMIDQFIQKGYEVRGMDLWIDGDVPLGAGMSSSAALCSAFGFALNEWYGWDLSRMELALAGQRTEHEFAGVMCGIMDQFASLHGKAGHLMQLDCRNLDYKYMPFDFPQYRIVLLNTMVSHSLAGSEFNVRRSQCEEGVEILRRYYPLAKSLRDISIEQLESHSKDLPDTIYRRCRFVISENNRLLKGATFLEQRDLASFGSLMFLSHEGLSRDYEVSCEQSDFLVAHARSYDGVIGARQMGGGFGGCTINIVRHDLIDGFIHTAQQAYVRRFHTIPEAYITQIEEGAQILQTPQRA